MERRTDGVEGAVVGAAVSVLDGHISGRVRIAAAALGTALAASGAVAVFVTANSVGASALVAAGCVVGLLGLFANRVSSVEAGSWKFQMATTLVAAANEAERKGDPAAADALREQASRLISAAEPFASQYEELRRSKTSGWERTRELEKLFASQSRLLAVNYPDTTSLERLFDTDRDGNRISAIGIMKLTPALASARVVIDALRNPRSAFEQWHALKVAELMLAMDMVAADDRDAIRQAVQAVVVEDKWGASTSDRRQLAEQILARF